MFFKLLGVFGGLALFLHGMQMMSSGLEAAGSRMKSILERLTTNRFMGVLVEALITTAVQSSSATTVTVVGFVNARMMTLAKAILMSSPHRKIFNANRLRFLGKRIILKR